MAAATLPQTSQLSFSPAMSNSSHTLSSGSHPSALDLSNGSANPLITSLSTAPHAFLQPPPALHAAALALAKRYLDPLASQVSEVQNERLREARKKRKRGADDEEPRQVLKLNKVHVDGFAAEQVWEQAQRVLDAAKEEVERALPKEDSRPVKTVRFDGEGLEISGSDDEGEDEEESELGEEGVDWEYDGEDVSGEEDEDEEESGSDGPIGDHDDYEDEDMEEDGLEDEEGSEEEEAGEFVEDKFGLNDGFFSIDEFNKQSEFLEQKDLRGEDDNDDDEEDIDWGADPLAAGPIKAPRGDQSDEEESDEEDGPTFGNADLNAPEGASDDEMDDEDDIEDEDIAGMSGLTNTNNIMYADFFVPPPKKGTRKNKRGRPNPHNFPPKNPNEEADKNDEDDDVERTMAAVHRDLFEDSDPNDSEDALSDVDPGDPKSRRSTHERRQAKLQEEIRRLEAENVAKRQWTLSGEARAADRPLNSLLEEDLDFERAGKPVPVITQEVSEDIEALIKRRILAQEFDEVIRRRPGDLATGPARRGRFELEDTKNGKSLAELYEEEHRRQTDPTFVEVKDEKLRKEHAEIEALWKSVSAKLDSLSSWHYKPKPAAPSLDIRVDAPAITMEDARPTAGGEVAGASMLAPQEVYRPGEEKAGGEVVTKAGLPIAREEMTREQKLRRRRREKERLRKASGNAAGAAAAAATKTDGKAGQAARDKKQVLADLKKGGVKVVGKRGEVTDVEGKKVAGGAGVSVGKLRL